MSESPAPRYGRPKISHALDPNEVNWLWKLIGEAAGVYPREVKAALEEVGSPLPLNRVKAWAYGEQNPNRSSMNLTELVTVLQAIIQHRARSKEDASALQALPQLGFLSDHDADLVDELVASTLERYRLGEWSREQAISEVSHLIAAIDNREVEEIRRALDPQSREA